MLLLAAIVTAGCGSASLLPAGGNDASAVNSATRVQAEVNAETAFRAVAACDAQAEAEGAGDLSGSTPMSCDAAAVSRTSPDVGALLTKGQAPGGVTLVRLPSGGFQVIAHAGQVAGSAPMTYGIESTPEVPVRKFCAPPDPQQCPNGAWPEA